MRKISFDTCPTANKPLLAGDALANETLDQDLTVEFCTTIDEVSPEKPHRKISFSNLIMSAINSTSNSGGNANVPGEKRRRKTSTTGRFLARFAPDPITLPPTVFEEPGSHAGTSPHPTGYSQSQINVSKRQHRLSRRSKTNEESQTTDVNSPTNGQNKGMPEWTYFKHPSFDYSFTTKQNRHRKKHDSVGMEVSYCFLILLLLFYFMSLNTSD
ncbi:unnamed protein product [Trichobilharzia regenti]|nr:unnamed protein product [Trichobilharzia regenti]